MTIYCNCFPLGYCRNNVSIATTEAALTRELVHDARAFANQLTSSLGLSAGAWPVKLIADYRDFRGIIVSPSTNRETYLDTELLFERPDPINEPISEWDANDDFYPCNRRWYRDNLMTPPGARVRIDNKPRWSAVISILRATYPAESILWGVRAANDNDVLPTYQPPRCGGR